MLDGSEIDFELEGPWSTGDGEAKLGRICLTFIDPSLGGTGYLDHAAEEMHLVARHALDHLDHPGCETACYRCLKSYANQRFHELLRWPLAVSYLEALATEPPERQPTAVGDIDDPGPWLEAYAAGVGSPLELRFLRLFEQHGFHPAKQVSIAARAGEPPISIADFAVPERRLAIYIDGASVHVGSKLRRDRHIRTRLRNGDPPWQVEELRAPDLSVGAALVARLKMTTP
jgi:MrfA Zn-binding domain